jgi:hypothetical protein
MPLDIRGSKIVAVENFYIVQFLIDDQWKALLGRDKKRHADGSATIYPAQFQTLEQAKSAVIRHTRG